MSLEEEFIGIQENIVMRACQLIHCIPDFIYVYMSNEHDSSSFNVFYKIGNLVLTPEKTDNPPSKNDINNLFDDGLDAIGYIKDVFRAYNQESPKEIRITYSVRSEELSSEFFYESKLSDTVGANELLKEWMKSVS